MSSRTKLLVATAVACIAVVAIWLNAHRTPEADLAQPAVAQWGALDRTARPALATVIERFKQSFESTQRWVTLSEEQRTRLLNQVGSYAHAMLGDALTEVPPLMAAWGGKPGPRMTPERIEVMWSEPGRNFPWTSFNPDQAQLTAVGIRRIGNEQAIDIPHHKDCSHHSMGTFFDFGENPLFKDRITAMVAMPVESATAAFTVGTSDQCYIVASSMVTAGLGAG